MLCVFAYCVLLTLALMVLECIGEGGSSHWMICILLLSLVPAVRSCCLPGVRQGMTGRESGIPCIVFWLASLYYCMQGVALVFTVRRGSCCIDQQCVPLCRSRGTRRQDGAVLHVL